MIYHDSVNLIVTTSEQAKSCTPCVILGTPPRGSQTPGWEPVLQSKTEKLGLKVHPCINQLIYQ